MNNILLCYYMFDNFQDYTLAELKRMIIDYKNYHNITITKKKKQELVDLLNEKFVLRNNVLYMKLEDGEQYLDRTENYLKSINPEQLNRHIPERIRKLPSQKKATQSKRHRWDSVTQLNKQKQRNAKVKEQKLAKKYKNPFVKANTKSIQNLINKVKENKQKTKRKIIINDDDLWDA